MLVFLLQLTAELEILIPVAFEIGLGMTGRKVLDSWLGDASDVSAWSASLGQTFLGLLAGGVNLLLLPTRFFAHSPLPGVSVLLAPIGTGLLM